MLKDKIKQNLVVRLIVVMALLTCGAILNVIQIVLYVFVRPFSKKIFYFLMDWVFWTFFAHLVFLYDFWCESELVVYGKKDDLDLVGNENGLVLCNHSYEIDWLVFMALCGRYRILGSCRGVFKQNTKFIPIFGWFFCLAGNIFIERSFEKDKKLIEEKFSEYMTCTKSSMIFVMAEGSRFTKEKSQDGLKFAKEKGVEPLKHHLIPRSKGFATMLPILKKYNCPAVYNFQVAFDTRAENPPIMKTINMGKKITAHVYIDRIPIENAEPTFDFLYEMFKTKDALQDSMYKYGNFYEGRGLKVEQGYNEKPLTSIIINSIGWILFELFLIIYLANWMIQIGQAKLFAVISITVFTVSYAILKILDSKLTVKSSH